MKVKRYFATSMRRALDIVREEQGPDVMILSNRKVDGGVELMTAIESGEAGDDVSSLPDSDTRKAAPVPPPVRVPVAAVAQGERRERPAAPELWTSPAVADRMETELRTLRALIERQLPSIAWRDFGRQHPIQAALIRQLSRLGVQPRVARDIASQVSDEFDFESAWRRCLGLLAHRVITAPTSMLEQGGVVAMIGPPGVGKSTVIAKCAAQFALRHGANQVAMITADNARLAAQQQLQAFGRILGIETRKVMNAGELAECVANLQRHRLILIDTPGLPPSDPRMQALLTALQDGKLGARIELVLSATTDYRTLAREVEHYAGANPAGLILTHVDEAAQLGPAMSVFAEGNLPLTWISAGQRVPDDLEPARAHQLVARAVKLARQIGDPVDNLEFEPAFQV